MRSLSFSLQFFLLGILIGAVCLAARLCQLPAQAKPDNGASTAGVKRVLHFPTGKSLGAILLCTYYPDIDCRGQRPQVAGGMGTITVDVPVGRYIMLEANRRVFENPALLDQISSQGIDALKLGFISMDDREDGMCDRAMAQIPHFTELTGLDVDRSEASDKGLSNIAKLKKLSWISCVHSDTTGEFFKLLPGLPEFAELNCSWCAIDEKNFAYLPRVKMLAQLDVSRTGLSEAGMRELSKCTELRTLRIAINQKLTDESLRQLLPLKKLTWLDLRQTRVTMQGLRNLRTLHLKKLAVPSQLSGKSDISELKKLFPGAVLVTNYGASLSDDVKSTYAPLK